MKVTPDLADIQLGITVMRSTVKAARAAGAEAMNGVLGALNAIGIADADIQTSYFNINPVYDYQNGQKLTGYQVNNIVSVHVRDLAKLTDVVDGAVAGGGTTVNGITFDVSDRSKLEQDARTAAVHDARAHADVLAAAAGVTISGVASISDAQIATPIPYAMAAREFAKADTATPIEAGTTSVTLTVSVVYLIE